MTLVAASVVTVTVMATWLVSTPECIAGSSVVDVVDGVGSDGDVGGIVGVGGVCGSWALKVLLVPSAASSCNPPHGEGLRRPWTPSNQNRIGITSGFLFRSADFMRPIGNAFPSGLVMCNVCRGCRLH